MRQVMLRATITDIVWHAMCRDQSSELGNHLKTFAVDAVVQTAINGAVTESLVEFNVIKQSTERGGS